MHETGPHSLAILAAPSLLLLRPSAVLDPHVVITLSWSILRQEAKEVDVLRKKAECARLLASSLRYTAHQRIKVLHMCTVGVLF